MWHGPPVCTDPLPSLAVRVAYCLHPVTAGASQHLKLQLWHQQQKPPRNHLQNLHPYHHIQMSVQSWYLISIYRSESGNSWHTHHLQLAISCSTRISNRPSHLHPRLQWRRVCNWIPSSGELCPSSRSQHGIASTEPKASVTLHKCKCTSETPLLFAPEAPGHSHHSSFTCSARISSRRPLLRHQNHN
jgi:hypothetical protein